MQEHIDFIAFCTDDWGYSMSLPVNGVINLMGSVVKDNNGSLRVVASSEAENHQKMGRAGRIFQTMAGSVYHTKNKREDDIDADGQLHYTMEKKSAMQIVLELAQETENVPVVGISDEDKA